MQTAALIVIGPRVTMFKLTITRANAFSHGISLLVMPDILRTGNYEERKQELDKMDRFQADR